MKIEFFIGVTLIYLQLFRFYQTNERTRGRHKESSLIRRAGSSYYYSINDSRIREFWRRRGHIIEREFELKSFKANPFSISKPKPWRSDNPVAIRANKANEEPADPNDTDLEMKPKMQGRILSSKQKKRS